MASYVLVIALTAFLAGAASAVFVMLVVGIRKVDRPRTRPRARGTALDAVTRSTLGAGAWPNGPALGDRQDH
jgi:multisubunit Na+/H+ antiporter MnhB subunit